MSTRLVDYIAICGLDTTKGLDLVAYYDKSFDCPLNLTYKSSILHHYPVINPYIPFDEQAVGTLCLPAGGVKFKTQKQGLKPPPSQHTFVMTHEDGSRVYGHVITYNRKVGDERVRTQMRSLNAMYLAELSNRAIGGDFNDQLISPLDPKYRVDVNEHESPDSNTNEFSHNDKESNQSLHDPLNESVGALTSTDDLKTPESNANFSSKRDIPSTNLAGPTPVDYYKCCFVGESSLEYSALPQPSSFQHKESIEISEKINLNYPPEISIKGCDDEADDKLDSPSSLKKEAIIECGKKDCKTKKNKFLKPVSSGKHKQPNPNSDGQWLDDLNLYDYEKDDLYASQGICLLSRIPFKLLYADVLRLLLELISSVDDGSNEQRSLADLQCKTMHHLMQNVLRLLLVDIELPLSNCLTRYSFSYSNSLEMSESMLSTYCFLPGAGQLALFDFDIASALCGSNVDIKNFLKIFTCLLLERQILVVSMDCDKLCTFCETLKVLMFPFAWHHVYVPVLPPSLVHFIQAPVPFLMGVNLTPTQSGTMCEDLLRQMPNLCFVNLDSGYIQFPDDDTPEMPDMRAFAREIKSTLKERKVSIGGDPLLNDSNEVLTTKDEEGMEMKSMGGVKETGKNYYCTRLKINNAIRCCFLYRFVSIFHDYETFIVSPQKRDTNKDISRLSFSFDSCAFLSDQRPNHVPFLAAFLDTQAFRSLIAPTCNQNTGVGIGLGSLDFGIFKSLIAEYKGTLTGAEDLSFQDTYSPCPKTLIQLSENVIVERCKPENCKTIHMDLNRGTIKNEPFSGIDFEVEEKKVPRSQNFEKAVLFDFSQIDSSQFSLPKPLSQTDGVFKGVLPRNKLPYPVLSDIGSFFHKQVYPKEVESTQSKPNLYQANGEGLIPYLKLETDQSPAALAHTNWKFVEALLRETKLRIKRLLLEKLGADIKSGYHEMAENVLVAGLCDMLERMWSHGLIKKRGQSALWEHLMLAKANYQQAQKCDGTPLESSLLTPLTNPKAVPGKSSKFPYPLPMSPSLQSMWEVDSQQHGHSSNSNNTPSSNSVQDRKTFFNFSTWSIKETSTPYNNNSTNAKNMATLACPSLSPSKHNEALKGSSIFETLMSKSIWPSTYVRDPLRSTMATQEVSPTLEHDISTIQNLGSMVHSETGLARAFIRLALQRKLLHNHLQALLKGGPYKINNRGAVNEFIRKSYKRYAFLRSEDETEQFLCHILSLNAADYFCFTNSFPSLVIPYKMLFIPSKPLNFYTNLVLPRFTLTGHMGRTECLKVPNQSLEFEFKHKNLGKLISLKLQSQLENGHAPPSSPTSPNKTEAHGGGGFRSVANLVSIGPASHDPSSVSGIPCIIKILIRNEITGRVFSFSRMQKPALPPLLSRPFDSNNDTRSINSYEPSVDTLLIADMLPCDVDVVEEIRNVFGNKADRHKSKRAAETTSNGNSILVEEIKESLSSNTDNIANYFSSRTPTQPTSEVCSHLFTLLCGQNGLVSCIERIFHYERRPYSKFFKPQQHIWEFLGRVDQYLGKLAAHHSEGWSDATYMQVTRFCEVYNRFQKGGPLSKFDKDTKFRGFVCQAFKEHLLHHWVRLIAETPIAISVYLEASFFRNQELLKHLYQTFEKFDDTDMEFFDLSLP